MRNWKVHNTEMSFTANRITKALYPLALPLEIQVVLLQQKILKTSRQLAVDSLSAKVYVVGNAVQIYA